MRTRMSSFCTLAVLAVFMLGGPRTSSAQQVVKLGEGETLTISGFISATMFTNRGLFASFGQGQNAAIAASPANQPATDKSITDGDFRNTRLNFTFTGPRCSASGRREPQSSSISSGRSTACRRSGTSSRKSAAA